jgi:hypothetical protein
MCGSLPLSQKKCSEHCAGHANFHYLSLESLKSSDDSDEDSKSENPHDKKNIFRISGRDPWRFLK